MTTPLQSADDQHFFEQPGSEAGMPETLIEQDSPNIMPEVNTGQAIENTIEPISEAKLTDTSIEPTDKDKNLRTQFIDTGAIDAQQRK